MKYLYTLFLITTLFLSSCEISEPKAAVLVKTQNNAQDQQTLADLIGEILNADNITLGEDAFIITNEVIIERQQNPSLQPALGRNYSRPEHFRLKMQGQKCFLEHIETGQTKSIDGLNCSFE